MTEPGNLQGPQLAAALKLALAALVGALLGGGVYGVAAALHARQPHVSSGLPVLPPVASAKKQQPAPVDATKAPETKQAVAPDGEAAEQTPAPEDPKARALAARTAAEQALLDEARTQLEAKNAAAAQATLDRMKKKFPRGSLVQERELLRIEVFKARGQLAAAKRAAHKFAKSFPQSPHLGELESLSAPAG